jgi:hypothetical protein
MAKLTFLVGVLLVAVGVVGYLGSGAASVTALIPAFIGIIFVALGLLGRNERLVKHSMHAAMLLALLAIGGTFSGILAALSWIAGTPPERPMAVVAQTVTALACALLLVGGIRSFIAARRGGDAAV